MRLLETLSDREGEHSSPVLTTALRQIYDGDLQFRLSATESYVVANFVSTLDGVISFNMPGLASGTEISGSNEADHFVMGLLRASADAIIVGARTIRDVGSDSLWTAEYSHPPSKVLYEEYRTKALGKGHFPIVVVASGTGNLELTRAVFRTPDVRVVIFSTVAGRDALTKAGVAKLSNVEVFVPDAKSGRMDPSAITQLLFEKFNARLLLHEGGPSLFTQFLEAGLVHELFLTLSPQVAGRVIHAFRPGLVEGLTFTPETAPWFRLISTKSAGNHLFLRYRYSGARTTSGQG